MAFIKQFSYGLTFFFWGFNSHKKSIYGVILFTYLMHVSAWDKAVHSCIIVYNISLLIDDLVQYLLFPKLKYRIKHLIIIIFFIYKKKTH